MIGEHGASLLVFCYDFVPLKTPEDSIKVMSLRGGTPYLCAGT